MLEAPFGPCIATADEIGDPHALELWLTVNGETKQKSNTRHMLFKIPTLIADIIAAMTLEAGVERIGTIRHPVVAA